MIFVTGGTGFLGSYILQELVLQGKPCSGPTQETCPFRFIFIPGLLDKISWVQGDILDVNGLMENLAGLQSDHTCGGNCFI